MPKTSVLVFILAACGAVAVIIYISFQRPQDHTLQHNEVSVVRRSDRLFSNFSKIRHCVTTNVIGVRLSVPLISFNKLIYHKEPENSQEREVSFQNIFDKRIWGGIKGVHFRASGNQSRVATSLRLRY